MISFTQKKLDLTIQLGTGTFGEQVGSTVTLSGLRMFADIASPCGESMGAAHIRVHGLTQSMMNQLTVIGPINQLKPKNQVILSAGDADVMSTAFSGTIYTAWADYSAAPEVVFNIIAYIGMTLAMKPVNALSYPGSADVVKIMSTIAQNANLDFINDGVSGIILSNQYLPGTAWQQIKACAAAAYINFKVENNALTIWPKDKSLSNGAPVISPDNGMVGYPALSSQGMTVKTLYNQNVVLGGNIKVESSLNVANGTFIVFNYTHSLSSEAPGGPWFTTIDCRPLETT